MGATMRGRLEISVALLLAACTGTPASAPSEAEGFAPPVKIRSLKPSVVWLGALSGGLSMRCLVPDMLAGLVHRLDKWWKPLYPLTATYQRVVLEKVPHP